MSLKNKQEFRLAIFKGMMVIGILSGVLNQTQADTANLNLKLTIITPPPVHHQ
ncbi:MULTISPECIES: hypothetical protein [Providencia]|uniref:hypothetical protein n=1 Tax=Providencia TaxID=586 RepID=UPI001FF88112|nr:MULTISPECIES: hypothetical protein [Providencia]WOC03627.1 hypothetical protein P3L56_17775 [Providencia sp. PROV024]